MWAHSWWKTRGAKDASGNDLNTGADVKKSLLDAGTFDWKSVETRDKAVQGVSDGTYDFALVIPKDFSARLVSTGSFKPDEKGNTGPINPQPPDWKSSRTTPITMCSPTS